MEPPAADIDKERAIIVNQLKGYVDEDLLRGYQQDDGRSARECIEQLRETAKEKSLSKQKAKNSTTTKVEKFAKGADDFLAAVTGPSDIIKGAVPMGAGNVVVGMVTILVKIGAEKKVQDDLIADSLRDVTSWLRRIDGLEAAYVNIPKDFSILVARFYDQLIVFLRSGVQRLSSQDWRSRIVAALRPKGLKEATNALKESIADLFQEYSTHQSKQVTELGQNLSKMSKQMTNLKSDNLELSKQMTSLRQDNLEMSKQMTDLKRDNSGLKEAATQKAKADFARSRNSAMHDTATVLQLPARMNTDTMLRSCRKAHHELPKDKKIWQDRRKSIPLIWGGLQTLEAREKYQAWMETETPCLLLLNGNSYLTNDQRYSWLSPITTELYDRLMDRRSAKALFFSGHQEFGQNIKCEDRYPHVLWAIALQALQLEVELADDPHDDSLDVILKEVTAKAQAKTLTNGHLVSEEQLPLIREILVAAIRRLRLQQPLYIILDGIVWGQEYPQRLAFELIQLVLGLRDQLTLSDGQRQKLPVKVLAVAKYDQWPTMASNWRTDVERAFSHRLIDLEQCVIDDLDCHQGKA